MPSITRHRHIHAPPSAVWNALADLGEIEQYHPGVERSYYITEVYQGEGAARTCEFGGGRTITEEARRWEPERLLELELVDSSGFFMRSGSVRFDLEPAGAGTLVTLRIDYAFRGGPIGALMGVFARGSFDRVAKGVLENLEGELGQ